MQNPAQANSGIHYHPPFAYKQGKTCSSSHYSMVKEIHDPPTRIFQKGLNCLLTMRKMIVFAPHLTIHAT